MFEKLKNFVKQNQKEIVATVAVSALAYYYRDEITPAVIGVAAGVYFHKEIEAGVAHAVTYITTPTVIEA
jgi:hypothetical protein